MAKKEKGQIPGVAYSLDINDDGHLVATPSGGGASYQASKFVHNYSGFYHARTQERQQRQEQESKQRGKGELNDEREIRAGKRAFSVNRKGQFKFHVKKYVNAYSEEQMAKLNTDDGYSSEHRKRVLKDTDPDGVHFSGTRDIHHNHYHKLYPELARL